MAPRLPTKSDFPTSLALDIVPPTPSTSPIANIIILLHGLGDTQIPFTSLARSLQLPNTAYLSIRAPAPIPAVFTGTDTPSFHWGDDIIFDEQRGELDLEGGGFKTTMEVLLKSVIGEALIEKCGFQRREIFFLGFGQGGMVALSAVAADTNEEFGGVISIGGRLSANDNGKEKSKTSVLVLGGSKSTQVTRSAIDVLKGRFTDFNYVKWDKGDDSMPKSREEMLPIMKFFARRLRSRAGVPEGAIEV